MPLAGEAELAWWALALLESALQSPCRGWQKQEFPPGWEAVPTQSMPYLTDGPTEDQQGAQYPEATAASCLLALGSVCSRCQSSFCSLWVLVSERQAPSFPPFPCEAPLLQPLQGGDFCLCILALSSIPGSGAIRRARPGPSHKSAGLI